MLNMTTNSVNPTEERRSDSEMKRQWRTILFISLLASMIVLAGCQLGNRSATPKASSKTASKVVKPTVPTVNYISLPTAERAKVIFAFKGIQDTGSTDTSGKTGTVSMTVTNHTRKSVRFDRSKFTISAPANANVTSRLTGAFNVKPGKTRQIHNIFSHVNTQYFVSAGTFLYLDQHYPLAYTYNTFSDDGVTSANLKDKKVVAINTPQAAQSQESSTPDNTTAASSSSATSTASSAAQSSPTTANTASSTQATIITNGDQAKALMAHAFAVMEETLTVTPVNGGWQVTSNVTPLLSAVVHPDGSATYSDGTTQSYAENSAPTNNGHP